MGKKGRLAGSSSTFFVVVVCLFVVVGFFFGGLFHDQLGIEMNFYTDSFPVKAMKKWGK